MTLVFDGGGPSAFTVLGQRFAPRPGDRQPDRQCPLVLAARQRRARDLPSQQGTTSTSSSRTKARAFAPDALEKVFERFYTDRPNHGFGQNSGLGLSISKQIVEAHDGRIWVENRLGEPAAPGEEPPVLGARFTVRLPAG